MVFTCLNTRASFVDMATDLSTEKFLLALRRFIGQYGQPHQLSDNGSNFVGAAKEIREMIRKWKSNERGQTLLNDFCAENTIRWTFSAPLAPHHNGVVESIIKSVKSSLNKIVKNAILSEEEYSTIFAEITASINSRPIWPSTEGDIEQPPLTCQDLIRPSYLDHDPTILNIDWNPRKKYEYLQKLVNEWWKL